jgi:mannosyltransferase
VVLLGAWTGIAVTACVIGDGRLRFVTLGQQSYEGDEAWTLRLLHQSFGVMLHGVSRQESTPPLYYVLAWMSAHLFGFGEFAVRAPSAIAGSAMVALAYPTAFALLGRRWPAVAVAALTAVSPILVWYSRKRVPTRSTPSSAPLHCSSSRVPVQL